jgi:hypothetical protein
MSGWSAEVLVTGQHRPCNLGFSPNHAASGSPRSRFRDAREDRIRIRLPKEFEHGLRLASGGRRVPGG